MNMKINNEYVTSNNYADNFFTEDLNSIASKEGLFAKTVQGVAISKSEEVKANENYNKYGEYDEVCEDNIAENNTKALDITSLKENLKNVLGEMDGSDYERLKQWGMAPADDESEQVVTVYERIQIQLMTYCEDYNGTGLNIDKNKMAKVLGSKSMAEAVAKSSDLSKFNDDTKEYMLKNSLEPTVDNVYMSIHSAAKREVSITNEEAVKNAVTEKLTKEGFELSNENVSNAMWLVSRGIEVNSNNMTRLSELNQIDELKTGDEQALAALSKNIAYSLYAGQSSKNAYITDRCVNAEDVYEVVEAVNNATDEELAYIASNNLSLNAANLMNARAADKSTVIAMEVSNLQVVEYKQVIYEARMVMTTASVYNLKRLGVDINYAEISKMTEEIVNERNKLLDMFMKNNNIEANEERRQLFAETINKMGSLSSLPQGIICKIHTQEIAFTMNAVYEEGTILKNQYEAAKNSYETLGTQVRRDLGDSYSKAFSNVDSLLLEIGMEINGANQRAVRILGYNSMEITVDNVEDVKEIATELDYLIENMTPKTALHLIKNGINPLEDNIRDVNEMLEKINEEIGKDDESMGKFLWNLEKKGQVTQEEKNDYIELYRILNMISKNEGNVIGRVINEGKELTLKNLYSAYKSKKAGDLDYSLSDEFAISYAKKNITTFMEHAGSIHNVWENGMPMDVSIEKMVDMVNEYILEEDKAYYEEEMRKYAEVENLSKGQLEAIVKNIGSQSVSNIAVYMEMTNAKNLYNRIKSYNETSEIIEAVAAQIEKDGEISQLDEMFSELEANGKEIVKNIKNSDDLTYERLQGAIMMSKTLQMMNSQAKKNSYFVPMEIGGQVTNIHLTINHSEATNNNVTVSMKNDALGSVSGIFIVKETSVMGRIVSDDENTVRMINDNFSIFKRTIETVGLASGEISCYRSDNEATYKYDGTGDENVSTNTYYSVAKAFVGMIKVGMQG